MKKKYCEGIISAGLGGFESPLGAIIEKYFKDERGEANKAIHKIISSFFLSVKSRPPSIRKQKQDADSLKSAITDLLHSMHPLDLPPYIRDGLRTDYEPLAEYGRRDDPIEEMKFLWKRLYHLHHQIDKISPPKPPSTNPGKQERNELIIQLLSVFESHKGACAPNDKTRDAVGFIVEVTELFSINLPVMLIAW